MTTFRARLTRALVTSTAAFLSIFCLALYLWCRSAFLADLDGDLEALLRADFAAAEEPDTSDPMPAAKPTQFGEFEVFKLLVRLDGKVVRSTTEQELRPDLSPESLRVIAEGGPSFADFSSGEELFRILSSPVKVGDETMIEVLGISQEPMQEALEELGHALGFSLLLGIGLVTLVSNRVAGYLTRPLEDILGQLESVTSRGDPGLRVTGHFVDDEMAGLQRETNAMLERLDRSFRSQKQFVSNASHELRAPLANLTLAIEVCLRRSRTPDEYLEVLQTCHGETRRLNEMANQLLTLSKGDEGALVLIREPLPVAEFLRGCLDRYATRAQAKGVRLLLSANADLIAEVDPIKIGQVVDNLLDNAIRHSREGTEVEVAALAADGLLEIRVQDRGPGMTPEQVGRLFERFYRADLSRHRGTGGAGLGLSISQALVEAHGGRLTAKSEPGLGTTLILRLPLGEGRGPANPPGRLER